MILDFVSVHDPEDRRRARNDMTVDRKCYKRDRSVDSGLFSGQRAELSASETQREGEVEWTEMCAIAS